MPSYWFSTSSSLLQSSVSSSSSLSLLLMSSSPNKLPTTPNATNIKLLLLCTLLMGFFIGHTGAINCYVCDASDTENPFQCGEWFERFDDPDIQVQNCSNVHDAKFCVKHVGRFEGGIGAKRFCSSKDLGNYCDYVRNKGDRMDYRSCIYTCDTDGCNGAVGQHSGKYAGAVMALLMTTLLLLFRH